MPEPIFKIIYIITAQDNKDIGEELLKLKFSMARSFLKRRSWQYYFFIFTLTLSTFIFIFFNSIDPYLEFLKLISFTLLIIVFLYSSVRSSTKKVVDKSIISNIDQQFVLEVYPNKIVAMDHLKENIITIKKEIIKNIIINPKTLVVETITGIIYIYTLRIFSVENIAILKKEYPTPINNNKNPVS